MMSLTVAERATLAFYLWEHRGRGYYHFNSPVEIEPPYAPFIPAVSSGSEDLDDGRVSLWRGIKKFISPPKEREEAASKEAELLPAEVDPQPELRCLSIAFPPGTEIEPRLMHEVLNLLSFSESPFSFEVLAQHGRITIQFTSHREDNLRLESHLRVFFPNIILSYREVLDINFDLDRDVAIADFGLDREFMLPIAKTESLNPDPLTSLIAVLGTLSDEETVIFQLIFKGVTAPWSQAMGYAVSDGQGGSFFEGYPEFVSETREKVSSPLFSAVLRIGVQGESGEQSRYIARELARSITSVSSSQYNRLVPLSNKGYAYDDHLRNIFYRTSNRLGFILNSKELAHFVHYPNRTVVSEKLGLGDGKTKRCAHLAQGGIYLGENVHHGKSLPVYLDTETRLSHTHIVGVTGVGKSNLVAKMMLADIRQGRGCAIFDPHGDICDDILRRIPVERKGDVIIVDPSDADYPIGFNVLEASTDAEKIVLGSDLVSAFKRHASAWGDNMTAVFQNAINTVLESSQRTTLIELKRFLIEEEFRREYLSSVDDPSLHYYWQNEYPMLRKGIAPLLTRIDTFLRPKPIRYMLAQKDGVDIAECVKKNKVVLLKLSQGLIGEQNSYLLASLFLAKFNQAALARQSQDRAERSAYMLFLDEFQNFITPSIERILSGSRKYALGICIAHQELGQIQETSLLNSVMSNPKTRICFRLGDVDAKRLASGFSYFDESDLQSLERGEAIVRIGSSRGDFNLATSVLEEVGTDYSSEIIASVRKRYARPRSEVDELLVSLLPNISKRKTTKKKLKPDVVQGEVTPLVAEEERKVPKADFEEQKEDYLKKVEKEERERLHRSIQNYVLTIGQKRGFVAELETKTSSGGRIDVSLQKEDKRIAVEVSVSNTIDYEVQNIQKCLDEQYPSIYMISESKVHLANIKKCTRESIDKQDYKKVRFGTPAQFLSYIDSLEKRAKKTVKRVRGYRVNSSHRDLSDADAQLRNSRIQGIILKTLKKKQKKS